MPEFRSKLRDAVARAAWDHGVQTGSAPSHIEMGTALLLIAADYLKNGAAPLHPHFEPWLSAAIHESVENWVAALHRDRPTHTARATALLDLAREALEYEELTRRARVSSAPYAQNTQPPEDSYAGS